MKNLGRKVDELPHDKIKAIFERFNLSHLNSYIASPYYIKSTLWHIFEYMEKQNKIIPLELDWVYNLYTQITTTITVKRVG